MYKVTEIYKNGKRDFSITEEDDVQKLPRVGQNGDPDAAVDSVSDESCNTGSTALLSAGSRLFYLDASNTWIEL